MRPRNRILVGVGAGLVPALLALLAVEGGSMFVDVSPVRAAGYFVQAIVLASLGGLATWLHDDIEDKKVLAEIGLAAPAFFKGIMGAGGAFVLGTQLSIATPLWAAQQAEEVPRSTASREFLGGLLGIKTDRYLVEVYDDQRRAGAEATFRDLERRFPSVPFRLFSPTEGVVDEWIVAIDGPTTQRRATRILKDAEDRGIPGAELRRLEP